MTAVEDSERTVEERLGVAERKIEAVERDVSTMGWAIGGAALMAVIIAVVMQLVGGQEPKPSNRDATLDELLSKGEHCYDSAPERAAARQRALAAIDRIKWDNAHPETPADPMWGSAPSAPVPSVWDTPPQSESWDSARCFEIMYTP